MSSTGSQTAATPCTIVSSPSFARPNSGARSPRDDPDTAGLSWIRRLDLHRDSADRLDRREPPAPPRERRHGETGGDHAREEDDDEPQAQLVGHVAAEADEPEQQERAAEDDLRHRPPRQAGDV